MSPENPSDRRRSRSLRGHLQRLARANRLKQVGAATVAVLLISGAVFARCGMSNITGPEQGPSPSGGPSGRGDLVSTGDVVDWNLVPLLPSNRRGEDEGVAKADPDFVTSTETTFPTTEVVHNVCTNEDPVLNGFIKSREKLKMNDLTLKYTLRTWKDTRGLAAAATTTYDDDKNPLTPPRTVTVRYRNRENTLDYFETGPAGLPFQSDQEDRIYLERLSPEHGMKYGPYDDREDDDDDREYRHGAGDDMFVFARQRVRIDKNGVARERNEFRVECK